MTYCHAELAHIMGSRTHGSQLMHNILNPPQQYSKRQTRADEIEKCQNEGLEPTYHSLVPLTIFLQLTDQTHLMNKAQTRTKLKYLKLALRTKSGTRLTNSLPR